MKKFTKIALIFAILAVVASSAPSAYAGDVKLLSPLPGVSESTSLGGYIGTVFNLLVGVATGLAVIMIIIGGITYMVTGSVSQKIAGKEMIYSAVFGLLLALAAWLILYTINPNIINLNIVDSINKLKQGVSEVSAGAGNGGPGPDPGSEEAVRTALGTSGVQINNDPCPPGQTTGCTNVAGLPQNAIDGLINLHNRDCLCQVMITGGTEGGHLTHGPGKPIVDLRPNSGLNSYIRGGNPNNPSNGYTRTVNGDRYTFETGGVGNSSGDHWHVVFD